jgi:mutator family transposase
MNGLPGLRLLPDAPVPDGRTVLPTRTPSASRRPLGHGQHLGHFIPVTNPLERFNKEIGRRTDVVGIFPDDRSLVRLAGMLCIEQNDERLVGRGYLSAESISMCLAGPAEHTDNAIKEEVPELQPA